MNQKPYRGRQSLGRRILTTIVVVLTIALVLAVVALFVLPNYVVYNGDTIQLDLSFLHKDKTQQTAQPSGGEDAEPSFVIEEPDPSPSPSLVAPPELKDLPPRRTAPLGLVPYEEDKALGARQGFLFTAQQVADFDAETAQEDYDYVAVYVDADELEEDELEARCLTLASQGVDELVIAGEVDVQALREALPADVYHGYLSIVAGKEPFLNDTQQGRDYAKYCDRVYVPGGSWNGLNLLTYLRSHDFVGTSADIVTIVTAPVSTNWAWAVLPA